MQLQRNPARMRWARRAGVIALVALAAPPLAAAAAPRHLASAGPLRTGAQSSADGAVLGGLTSQDFPVVVTMTRSGKRIAEANAAINLPCETGGSFTMADSWSQVKVSKRGRFSVTFGPESQTQDDGTTVEAEGSFAGRFNKSRTSVSGTWSLKGTFRDEAGVVTDTCDSGSVDWRARD
jgi:hypothetical protein